MESVTPKSPATALEKITRLLPFVFCVVAWAMLAFYERSQLLRIDAQSLFLYDDLFFKNAMNVPAGLLGYIGCFFTQFLYYPALGAALFVAMLALVYWLIRKAFHISSAYTMLAMLPLFLLLALNTQLGYWIYYIKLPGYWFIPVLGTIVGLLAIWIFNRASYKLHIPVIIVWTIFGYPLFGFYALFSALCMAVIALSMAIRNGNRKRLIFDGIAVLLVAAVLIYEVPMFWYNYYSSVAMRYIHTVGLPSYHWEPTSTLFINGVTRYWVPYILLFSVQLVFAALYNKLSGSGKPRKSVYAVQFLAFALALCFSYVYWYKNDNFRIENKQDVAMWEGDWRAVADYARDTELPSRQIVMNKNIALLNLGTIGDEMFTYPDGSADIDAPFAVHLTHTGGLMSYWCFGKFNFCYRWCVENAVERGWNIEYLKHSVRSMLLNGEYTLVKRYTGILKKTLFHSDWAERYEQLANNPDSIAKMPEFEMPLQMYVYGDVLDVDDSFVEAYLLNNVANSATLEHSPLYSEAALICSMTRKDTRGFWGNLNRYFYNRKLERLPVHYQEALLLFSFLDKSVDVSRIPIDKKIVRRFERFRERVDRYKGKKEDDIQQYFKSDFGDTYWYFYFFVRKIKTN